MKKHAIIPFFIPHRGCAYQCVYCNQKIITQTAERLEPEEIPRTIKRYLQTLPAGLIPEVAFYGGSFTAIPIIEQIGFLQAVQPFILQGRVCGIRISTRPDAIIAENLSMLAEYGVSVIELGVQSLDSTVLIKSGRTYEPSLVGEVSLLIRKYGFLLGHQMMIGLPAATAESDCFTAERIAAMCPDIARIYPTLVFKGTRLAEWLGQGSYVPLSLNEAVLRALQARSILESAGIQVIRTGLQPEDDGFSKENLLAGPYHPAFGELVDNEAFYQAAEKLWKETDTQSRKVLTYRVNPADLSKMIGQKRRNILLLQQLTGVNAIQVTGDAAVEPGIVWLDSAHAGAVSGHSTKPV